MLTRRFSAAELASHADLPTPTVAFFLRAGILTPSVQRATGRGRGNVYDYRDVLGAMALNALRLPNAAAAPLRHLVEFWHTPRGSKLAESLLRELLARARGAHGESEPTPCVLCVTNAGVTADETPADVMRRERTHVVFCVDARYLVDKLFLSSTEVQMTDEFRQPGPSGRAPSARSIGDMKPATRQRRKNAETKAKKTTKKTNRRSAR